jgi:hypothetical protein
MMKSKTNNGGCQGGPRAMETMLLRRQRCFQGGAHSDTPPMSMHTDDPKPKAPESFVIVYHYYRPSKKQGA